ncbi:MAG TPA: hypothetical protein ENK43_16150 [Planctomycetes bacterium]|nr:hypothetical protein [Planctomycetota bacterium]
MSVRILSLLSCLIVWTHLPPAASTSASPQGGPKVEVKRLMKTCKKCHIDQWKEWRASRHARSWTNPVFQEAIATLPDKGEGCARCHAPGSLPPKAFGDVPLARKDARKLGVNCTTCHNDPARYYGPYPSKGHGGILVKAEYLQAAVCKSCHGHPEVNEAHDQWSSYVRSPAAANGKTCQSCHMEEVTRVMARGRRKLKNVQDARLGRRHLFAGARTEGKAEDAADLRVESDGTHLLATVTMHTGHVFPSSEGREGRLEVRFFGGDGAEIQTVTQIFDKAKDHVLPPEEATTIRIPFPAAAERAVTSLVLRFPVVPGREKEKRIPLAETETLR